MADCNGAAGVVMEQLEALYQELAAVTEKILATHRQCQTYADKMAYGELLYKLKCKYGAIVPSDLAGTQCLTCLALRNRKQ